VFIIVSSTVFSAILPSTCLGADTVLYSQTFLNDPRGQNVRNRVSHGLARKKYFGKMLADRVVHILLVLSLH